MEILAGFSRSAGPRWRAMRPSVERRVADSPALASGLGALGGE